MKRGENIVHEHRSTPPATPNLIVNYWLVQPGKFQVGINLNVPSQLGDEIQ